MDVGSSFERRQAIESVLASETFRRAGQLKRLLSYLFEQDELGRSHEVTEYELGTRALGRPPDFAPDIDSTVRTRMHGLRQKLDEYRQTQARDAPRLQLPKGSYRLQFVSTSPVPQLLPAQHGRTRRSMVGAGFAAVAGLPAHFFAMVVFATSNSP